MIAYGRGANGSSGRFTPFQNDGADARAVINWIVKQEWSDKRVGMYGVAYSGFAVWAVARNLPPELKAIATTDATAPGIDSPMTGNIFQNSAYRWAYQVTHDGPEDKTFADDAQWRAFNQAWYTSGRRYREFPLGNTPGGHGVPRVAESSQLRPLLGEVHAAARSSSRTSISRC